jgi:hypothetical protein
MSACGFLSSYRWAIGSPSNLVARGPPSQLAGASTAHADCLDTRPAPRASCPAVQAPRSRAVSGWVGSASLGVDGRWSTHRG